MNASICISRRFVPSGLMAMLVMALLFSSGCSAENIHHSRTVTATAYTMRPVETRPGGEPGITAWGDRLRPGMKALAVSRDLVQAGLTHGTKVRIEGMDGTWIVRDKMASRWRNRIDLFMGRDVDSAREWGRQEVIIHWTTTPLE